MDPDCNDGKDGNSATKHVLDYYKKYSQNKQLPKYFSGSPVSYLPQIEDDPNVAHPIIVPNVIMDVDNFASVTQQSLDTSRASSAMSNRRLEWDNGADIGYENLLDVKVLRKSISLPLITEMNPSDFEVAQLASRADRARSEGSSSDSNVKVIVLSVSSSSGHQSPQIGNVYSSSSSQPEEKKYSSYSSTGTNSGLPSPTSQGSSIDKIAKFASSLSFLKQKIGLPGAHSTPKYLEGKKSSSELNLNTPLSYSVEKSSKKETVTKPDENLIELTRFEKSRNDKKPSSVVEIFPISNKRNESGKEVDKKGLVTKYTNNKVVNLAVTKPVTVECMCSPKTEKKTNPKTLKQSVGIQTDEISERELIQIIHRSERDNKNQSLIYFEYPDSDKTTCGIQTTSDAASPCDSFEYIKNNSGKNKSKGKNDEESVYSDKENSPKSCSDDICLGKVISATQLNNGGETVEKSIHLLHRLLKSKKYDPVTKKRYIKKIMQKLTESKYFEESSNSSDLFCPKKMQAMDFPPLPPKSQNTDTSDEKSEKNKLPLHQIVSEKSKVSPRKRKLAIKTYIQDFLPKEPAQSSPADISSPPEIVPIDGRDTKKNCFTLTNNEFLVKHDEKSSGIETLKPPNETDTSLEKQYQSSSSPKSANYENWRDDKTLSEKLLEAKSGMTLGEGDCLVRFAEKEREYQISWINNEISHLGKLKGLLEKPKTDEPIQNIKTTTVYTVSEEHDQSVSKSVKFKRNYVIETNLGTDSNLPMKFSLNNKKYKVCGDAKEDSDDSSEQIIGEIEVITSDSVTNIKVNAFCEACKRSPCTCVCLKCKKKPCNCSKLKPAICRTCHTVPCICQTGASRPHARCLLDEDICWRCLQCPCICPSRSILSSTPSGRTICLSCHRTPCICDKAKGLLSKTCLSCGRYPCIYKSKTSTISDEYTGTFVIACPPKSAIDGAVRRKYSTFPLSCRERGEKECGKCPVCKKCPCICDVLKRSRSRNVSSRTNTQYNCPICAQKPCICLPLNNKTCPECGKCGKFTCMCGKPKYDNCTICGKCPCICDTLKNCPKCGKFACFCDVPTSCVCDTPKTCPVCGKCKCICEKRRSALKLYCTTCGKCPCVCDTLKTKLDKRCSVCGKCPCICETIKREYLNRGTSVSAKSLSKCGVCDECPCVCEKSTSVDKCPVCSCCPCLCQKDNTCCLTRSTSVSAKTLKNCSLCGRFPCICDLLKKNVHTKSTSVSVKSLAPCSLCGRCPCVCLPLTRTAPCLKSPGLSRTGSLKKMFLNCNCSTQTNCTCDFVEKLIERFNKVDFTSSKLLRDCDGARGSLEKCNCQNIGIQTRINTRHQLLQTRCLDTVDTKIAQTEKRCQNMGIQTAQFCFHAQTGVCGDGLTQIEVMCSDEDKKKKPPVKLKCKCDKACTCEISQGTQTLGDKRVILTCSSDSSRPVSPVECLYDLAHSAGISHVKKKRSKRHCVCGADGRAKWKPTIVTEQYESKTESVGSDRYVTSSKSSTIVTSSYNATVDSSDQSSSKTGSVICICCKKKYPSEKISVIGSANQNFPLCACCLQRKPILTSLCYAGPEHICTCYKPLKNEVLQEIKTTVEDLCDLEYCTCTSPTRTKDSEYCCHCKLRLKSTAKTRNGIAYTLTLEDKSPSRERSRKRRKKPPLEEIRIRVPCPHKKEHKDKINLCRQDGDKSGVTVGYMERIRKQDRKCPRVKVVCGKTKARRSTLTLQDYLKKNKPDFIDSAETRRLALFNSKSDRELKKDEAKLRFFEDNRCHCNKMKKDNTKLFTEHEMKAITRRHYQKLPEVQQRNNERREKRLRNADKFIVDLFSTKIRNCALKGKKDFPLGKNIVSLPKT